MPLTTSKNFIELVRRSGLVDKGPLSKTLRTYYEQGGKDDAKHLADYLVRQDHLTSWQAQKMLTGKYKGFVLGNYKLLSQIASGGMGTVYLGQHLLIDRKVAIKILPKNRNDVDSYSTRFLREARAAAALDHPNIIRAYDVDIQGSQHFLVMEYSPGQDLKKLVTNSGFLRFEKAIDIIGQAARGLAHAHASGLIHRDVKPANLLVGEKDTVKILDLGLALFKDDLTSITIENHERVLGTADYLAPEQARNSHCVDARADIYSLGCTLFFALTGNTPFPGQSLAETIYSHQHSSLPEIGTVRPKCPTSLQQVCERMTRKSPDDRFQSATEVAQVLENCLEMRKTLREKRHEGEIQREVFYAGTNAG